MKFFCLLLLSALLSIPALSQQSTLPKGYYVIVGAFAVKNNAERFNTTLHEKKIESEYAFIPSRNLYYVYTLSDQSARRCLAEAKELRKQPEFNDAWVRFLDEKAKIDELVVETEEPAKVEEKPEPVVAAVETKTEPPVQPETDAIPVTDNEPIVVPETITLGNTEVFLSLYNARNDRVAEGNVQVIDTERAREIQEVKGNTYLTLPDPKSKSGKLTLICDVVGYRKVQKEIDFNHPLSDSSVVEEMGTQLVVNFDLVPYSTGDIRTLFNIYFFNEAAVMMPESKFELNGLLAMMNDNPNYRIRLHGHTNGNYHGKIIRRSSGGDFFSVSKDAKTSQGTAKELSESRAEAIREYLVEKGVDGSRVEVKAWGGKRPIYDKHSANAKKNIRVEVEIL
jgi:outer membrane protein OmpA-like peptidoglycan-associated protein